MVPGEFQTVIATIWESKVITLGRYRKGTETTIGDDTGNIKVVWFNQPYLAKSLSTGSSIVISGKVSVFGGYKKFESPQYELLDNNDLEGLIHTGRLVPVYPTTKNLAQRTFRKAIKEVNSEAWIVGEIWGDARKWLKGAHFDGVMNYRIGWSSLSWAGANILRKS